LFVGAAAFGSSLRLTLCQDYLFSDRIGLLFCQGNHPVIFSSVQPATTTTTTPLTRLFAMSDLEDPTGSWRGTTIDAPDPSVCRSSSSGSSSSNRKQRAAASIPHVPITSMSPSLVIATLGLPMTKHKARGPSLPAAASASTSRTATTSSSQDRLEPQCVLERLWRAKDIEPRRVKASEAKYDTVPTPLQLASYGTAVIAAVHTDDTAVLDAMFSAGLSRNPCNQFRDSLIDYACQHGKASIFRCFVDHGAELRVCDAHNRTPLHYCAWSPVFCESIVATILKVDPQQLYQEDKDGKTPLEVVSTAAHAVADWVDYLNRHQEQLQQTMPSVIQSFEQRVQLTDPLHNPLSIAAAKALSSGGHPQQYSQRTSPSGGGSSGNTIVATTTSSTGTK
jgi:hypothetical protein